MFLLRVSIYHTSVRANRASEANMRDETSPSRSVGLAAQPALRHCSIMVAECAVAGAGFVGKKHAATTTPL